MKQRVGSRNQKAQQKPPSGADYFEGRAGARRYTSQKARDVAKVDSASRDKLVLQGYSAGPQTYGEIRPISFGQTLNEFSKGAGNKQPKRQDRPKGLIYDDYSDGEISLIIDEDLRKSPDTNNKREQDRIRRAAAKEIFGEGDSNSNDYGKRDEKKEFRIKKDQRRNPAKPLPSKTINPVADLANLTGGMNRLKFNELENNYWKNKLECKTDKNLRDTFTESKRYVSDSIKDISVGEKVKKQMEADKDFRATYGSFYNRQTKEVGRSASSNTAQKFQNNFLKTNGFNRANPRMDTSRDEDKESNRNMNNQMRNYEKPWLINCSNQEMATTTTVTPNDHRTGEDLPQRNKSTLGMRKEETRPREAVVVARI